MADGVLVGPSALGDSFVAITFDSDLDPGTDGSSNSSDSASSSESDGGECDGNGDRDSNSDSDTSDSSDQKKTKDDDCHMDIVWAKADRGVWGFATNCT